MSRPNETAGRQPGGEIENQDTDAPHSEASHAGVQAGEMCLDRSRVDAADRRLSLTTFDGSKATDGKRHQVLWSTICTLLRNPRERPNINSLPLFKVATFRDDSRARPTTVLSVDALCGDYDGGQVSVDDAADRLLRAGIEAFIYTTRRHKPEAPRWRVMAPVGSPIAEEQHQPLMNVLNGALAGILAPESWEWTRSYFYGRVKDVEYRTAMVPGRPLDIVALCPDFAPIPSAAPTKAARTPRSPADYTGLVGDDVGRYLVKSGRALGGDKDRIFVECPRAAEHTSGSGISGSAWMLAGNGYAQGHYKCQHKGHETLPGGAVTDGEFLAHIDYVAADFDVVTSASLTEDEAAESAAAAIRRAARFSPPTLGQILERIEANDVIGFEPPELARLIIDDLVLANLGEVGQETALKALKDATGLTVKALRADLAQARRKGPSGCAVVGVEWPVPTAAALVKQRYTTGGHQTLRRWQEVFLAWNGRRYQEVGNEEIRAQIYSLYEDHRVQVTGRAAVDNTLDALRALVNVPNRVTMPAWLGGDPPVPVHELMPMGNGLLHVPTRELLRHNPQYFATGAVAVDFQPEASAPAQWLKFMADAFPGDPQSVAAMQEWFGYLLTADTSQQKALICVGPKRSGKGTAARILQALLGDYNVAGPTLGQLGRQFGLQGLIGKQLALVSDARVSGAADLQGISETLLRVTGEDAVSVERKGATDWVGRLPTRFVLMTNVLPGIVDGGGAVASRFIVLRFTQSFYGREDTTLNAKLMTELPGILNWALDGLAALRRRGAFTQPASGLDAVQELIRRTTPILGFVEDELVYDPDGWVQKDVLYGQYRGWCESNGQKHVLTNASFFAELYANTDGKLTAFAPRVGGKPVKAVRGVRAANREFDDQPPGGSVAGA